MFICENVVCLPKRKEAPVKVFVLHLCVFSGFCAVLSIWKHGKVKRDGGKLEKAPVGK